MSSEVIKFVNLESGRSRLIFPKYVKHVRSIIADPVVENVFQFVYREKLASSLFCKVCRIIYDLLVRERKFETDQVVECFINGSGGVVIDSVVNESEKIKAFLQCLIHNILNESGKSSSFLNNEYDFSWINNGNISFYQFIVLIKLGDLSGGYSRLNSRRYIYEDIKRLYGKVEILKTRELWPIVESDIVFAIQNVNHHEIARSHYLEEMWELFLELSIRMEKNLFIDNAVRRKMDRNAAENFFLELSASLKIINIFFAEKLLTEKKVSENDSFVRYHFHHITENITINQLYFLVLKAREIQDILGVDYLLVTYGNCFIPQSVRDFKRNDHYESWEDLVSFITNLELDAKPEELSNSQIVLQSFYKSFCVKSNSSCKAVENSDSFKSSLVEEGYISLANIKNNCSREIIYANISQIGIQIRDSFGYLGEIFDKKLYREAKSGNYKFIKISLPEELANISFQQFLVLFEIGQKMYDFSQRVAFKKQKYLI